MMADDLRSQPYVPSNSSEQPPSKFSDDGFLAGVAVGFLIPPTIFASIFAFHMVKARQSRPLNLPNTYRHCYHLRRPPICTASVGFFRATVEKSQLTLLKLSRTPWRWTRRAGGRFQVGTSLIAPGRWLSPLSSMFLRDTREAWPRDLVRLTTGVTQGQKKRKCLDMRRVILSLHDTDPCSDKTWLERINFEESMGAYRYRETLQGTVRTLRSPSGPFSRQSHPTESYKAGQ